MSVALNQLVSLFASLLLALTKIFFKKYLTILHSIIFQYARAKKVSIDGDDSDENGMVQKCYLRCEKCGSITEVDFEKSSGDSPSYTTGRGVE